MSTVASTDDRLTLTEVSVELGVSRATVARWCKRGIAGQKLACLSIGKRKFVRRAWLAEWLQTINRGNELPAAVDVQEGGAEA